MSPGASSAASSFPFFFLNLDTHIPTAVSFIWLVVKSNRRMCGGVIHRCCHAFISRCIRQHLLIITVRKSKRRGRGGWGGEWICDGATTSSTSAAKVISQSDGRALIPPRWNKGEKHQTPAFFYCRMTKQNKTAAWRPDTFWRASLHQRLYSFSYKEVMILVIKVWMKWMHFVGILSMIL